MAITALAACRRESKVERQALVAGDPSDTWLASALPSVCVAEIPLGSHRMTVALPTSSADSSKTVSALTTGSADIFFLAVTLTGPCVALI